MFTVQTNDIFILKSRNFEIMGCQNIMDGVSKQMKDYFVKHLVRSVTVSITIIMMVIVASFRNPHHMTLRLHLDDLKNVLLLSYLTYCLLIK